MSFRAESTLRALRLDVGSGKGRSGRAPKRGYAPQLRYNRRKEMYQNEIFISRRHVEVTERWKFRHGEEKTILHEPATLRSNHAERRLLRGAS